MSTRQLKLLDQINELTILRAFGPTDLCLTLLDLRCANISFIEEHVYTLIDNAVEKGIVHYKDAMYEEHRVRDENCTVTLVRKPDPDYVEALTATIRKAKLPPKHKVCAELYNFYCSVFHAELASLAKAVSLLEGGSGLFSNTYLGGFRNNNELTLRQITGFIQEATRLRGKYQRFSGTDKILGLASKLMLLGKEYDFTFPAVKEIQKSDFIQNQIFLDEYLFNGEWSLDKALPLRLFDYQAFPNKAKI